jgi:tetratricopeptide (TPR) repeat protein
MADKSTSTKANQMAKAESAAAPAPAIAGRGGEGEGSLADWAERHRKLLLGVGGVLVVAALGAWLLSTTAKRKEAFAGQQLSQARAIAESGDLPRAAAEFQRISESFRGTDAGQFAVVGLNQVRMISGQTELAVIGLREFLATGPEPRFSASAQALLGAALENSGKPQEAAAAYQAASDAADTPYLKADFLIQAGRAWGSAGDTAKAMAAYQRILDDFGEMPAVTEAKVRLSELTAATTATK